MSLEILNLKDKAEEARRKLKEKLKLNKIKPIPGTGLHVDPGKMATVYDSHTDSKGRPPIGGAQDD